MRIFPATLAALATTLIHADAAAQLRVALVGSAASSITNCSWVDVQSKLMATGMFSVVDIVRTLETPLIPTPSLELLRTYDALLVWTNNDLADNVTFGNRLADYVDEGGGVVVATFANSSTGVDRNIAGRWQLGYEVILDGTGNTSGSATLGTVHDPFHPVMAGVTTFSGGSFSWRPTGTALEVGSTVVASWSDGKVLVAQGLMPNRVDLGFYPPSSACTTGWWSGDGDKMMANALVHVANYSNYHPYGSGCAGSLGVPTLAATPGFRPVVGGPFQVDVGNAPLGIAIMVLGFSDTLSGGLPLPFDLGPIGMPGCDLLAEIDQTFFLFGSPPSATWSVMIPADPVFFGLFFYNQAGVADPGATSLDLTVTNGGRARIGT